MVLTVKHLHIFVLLVLLLVELVLFPRLIVLVVLLESIF